MIHLVAGVTPDVAHRLTHGDHEIDGLTLVPAADDIESYIEIDRPRTLLLISPEFVAGAVGIDASRGDWCTRIAELGVPVILACSSARREHEAIRTLCTSIRVDVWYYPEASSCGSLDALIESASLTSLSVAAWHHIRLCATTQPDARAITISRFLFRQPASFSHTLDISGFGISATWYNQLLRLAGLAPFSVLRRIARVLQACSLHARPRLTMVDIAQASGCGSVDTLEREVHLFAGVSPSRLFGTCSNEELIELGVAVATSPSHLLGDTRASA
jgi:hypothetical protein